MVKKAENFIIEIKKIMKDLNEEKISQLRSELNSVLEQ